MLKLGIKIGIRINVKSCDNTLLKLFRDFLRQRDQRIFIQKLSDFANSQIEKQKDNQSMDPYMKKIEQNNHHKDLIKDICSKFLKSKVKQNQRILLVEYSNLAIFDYYYYMYKVELVDSSEFKDRSKYYKHLLQTYFQWSFLKYFVYTIIWLIGGRISILYSMQGLYVIITGFALIFTNLGTREKGTLSAYSIFNKGYKKLMGQMTEEDVANMYNMGGVKKKKDDLSEDDDDDKISKDFEGLSMEQMMAKLSKLGNKQCFCNSGRKYKKCHYYIHQRIKQQEDEDRRKGIKQN